ncbi:hypothetical protein SAMN04488074_105127 [Lentzea albidocapillata subsp. violacea]|uniref:Uncharacterized protein n=1 Tax=Lentzea albidocapillata subsp. violacea TaxID=128104 RepID=A0A1G9AUZ5_9PSEU|nr:hypothetical protein [Lentzea albidocapillata]SDK31097.1 hypothetical protein SAMN04488074_105127 [Lentzea albidocapillata subsp. violacea]
MTAIEPTGDPFEHGVVHIAGLDVQIGQLLRQRCGWCAEVLVDYDLALTAVPEGQAGRPATWPVGGLVVVDGGVKVSVSHTAADQLPKNACVGLPAPWVADLFGEPPVATVVAVLSTWARCSPNGDPSQPLRNVNDSALNRVDNLARLAAQAVLAGPRIEPGDL